MGKFLKLLSGRLAPLFAEVRALILRKCAPKEQQQVRAIVEKQLFGELERLVAQKLLDVCKGIAKAELQRENWLHKVARASGRSYKQMRVIILEFLDTDVLHVSAENCASFLEPLIASWDIDLASFALEIVPNKRLASESIVRVGTEDNQKSEVLGIRGALARLTHAGSAIFVRPVSPRGGTCVQYRARSTKNAHG